MSDLTLPPEIELSPRGRARRAELLGELLGTMERVDRGRRRRRRVAAGLHLLAIGILVTTLVPSATVEVVGPLVETAAAPRVSFAFVETDPTILDRYAGAPSLRADVIDDASLLGALAAIDRPTGLVRRGDRVWLTDDVLAPRLP